MLLEFKKVVAEAKDKYKKQHKKEFPPELALNVGGCLMSVSTCTRQFMVRVDKDVNKWIFKGFQPFVLKHFEEELKAIKAIFQPLIERGAEKVFRYSGSALGVRDKIFWSPERMAWTPKLQKPKEELTAYCRKSGLRLQVSHGLVGDECRRAREQALLDACVAWNCLDGSGKHRIRLPAVDSGTPIQLALQQDDIDVARLADVESELEHVSDSDGEDSTR